MSLKDMMDQHLVRYVEHEHDIKTMYGWLDSGDGSVVRKKEASWERFEGLLGIIRDTDTNQIDEDKLDILFDHFKQWLRGDFPAFDGKAISVSDIKQSLVRQWAEDNDDRIGVLLQSRGKPDGIGPVPKQTSVVLCVANRKVLNDDDDWPSHGARSQEALRGNTAAGPHIQYELMMHEEEADHSRVGGDTDGSEVDETLSESWFVVESRESEESSGDVERPLRARLFSPPVHSELEELD